MSSGRNKRSRGGGGGSKKKEESEKKEDQSVFTLRPTVSTESMYNMMDAMDLQSSSSSDISIAHEALLKPTVKPSVKPSRVYGGWGSRSYMPVFGNEPMAVCNEDISTQQDVDMKNAVSSIFKCSLKIERILTAQALEQSALIMCGVIHHLRMLEKKEQLPTSKTKLVKSLGHVDKQGAIEIPEELIMSQLVLMGQIKMIPPQKKKKRQTRSRKQTFNGPKVCISSSPFRLTIDKGPEKEERKKQKSEPVASRIVPVALCRAIDRLPKIAKGKKSSFTVTEFKKLIKNCCVVSLGEGTSRRIVNVLIKYGIVNEVSSTSAAGGKFMKYSLSRPKRTPKRTRDRSGLEKPLASSRRRTALLSPHVARYRWPEELGDELSGATREGLRLVIRKTAPPTVRDTVMDSIQKGTALGDLRLPADSLIAIHSYLSAHQARFSKNGGH